MALLKPRALMAYWPVSTRATWRLGARRSTSGRLLAPERRMSSAVITKMDAAACDRGSACRDTEVISMLLSSSRLRSASSSCALAVMTFAPEAMPGCIATASAATLAYATHRPAALAARIDLFHRHLVLAARSTRRSRTASGPIGCPISGTPIRAPEWQLPMHDEIHRWVLECDPRYRGIVCARADAAELAQASSFNPISLESPCPSEDVI